MGERLDPDSLPVVLRQRAWRKLLALMFALWATLFLFAAGVLLATGIDNGDVVTLLAGVALLVVAGFFFLYWGLQLVPGSCRLKVSPGGFSIRHCFITRDRGWDEVGRFYVRTYSSPRINDFDAVAFTGEERRVVGAAAFLDELRFRGIADSDILPDTYGRPAAELAEFLNACSERYGQHSPDHVPQTIPVTLGYLLVVSGLLTAFIAGFLAYAIAALARRDFSTAALALVLASPLAFAMAVGWRRWRRGSLRRGARVRKPGDAEQRRSGAI